MKKLFFALLFPVISMSFISCDKEVVVQVADMPSSGQTFLGTHFPGVQATLIMKDNDGYEVKLSNGFEIDFDKKGNWEKIDGNHQLLPESVIALLHSNAYTYLQENNLISDTVFIVKFDKDGSLFGTDKIEVSLSNDLEVIFKINTGEFVRYDN